jgi:hypothetical protein
MRRDVEKSAAKQKKFDFVEKTARESMIRQHFGHLVKTDPPERKEAAISARLPRWNSWTPV